MKLTTFFFFVSTFALIASGTYSQNKTITINQENALIKDVLKEIEDQSGYFFIYNNEYVDVYRKINIKAHNQTINVLLDQIFQGQNVSYSIDQRRIILSPSENGWQTQQQKTVTGKVTDSSGASLPGVSVVVKGTTNGTITDTDGKYNLTNIPADAMLVFSFVGMKMQEVSVTGKTIINVKMEEETIGIDEIVAIGYGSAKRKDVTGAVGSVKSAEIIRSNPVQPAKALQGHVAGVNVNKVNSRPGSDYTIDIRGVHSISYSSEPLVVIDGVMGGKLNTLNPSDIETIDILKDASATAIYGSRGANGVIIVSTKKGKQGHSKITYDGYIGVKMPTNLPDLMTAQDFYHAYNDVVKAENPSANPVWTATELANVQAGKSVDWVDQVTDPSTQTSHVVSLSGGNEATTYYFSTGYLNEKGNLLNTGYERYNLKGSIDGKISEKIKAGFTSYYTYSVLNLGSNETLRGAYRVRPTGSIYYNELVNPAETNDKDVKGYAFWMGIKDTQIQNPILEVAAENYQDETRVSNFLGNGYLEITPMKGLSFKSSLSASMFASRRGEFRGADSKSRLNKLPIASVSSSFNSSYTWDNILTYKKLFGLHDLNITMAQSAMQERLETTGSAVENLPYNSGWYALNTAALITGVSSSLVERSILSFMGRVNYIFNEKYLLTLTGRYDGSSVLAEGNKWAFFPSAALAWRAGEEPFVKDLNLFSDLKVRLSYGEVGNDVVSPYSTQAYLKKTAYDFNGVAAYGYTPNNIGNADLKWENSAEINFGVNMGFLKNKIMVDLEYYNKKTNDLIQNVALPTSLGFGSVTANVGKLVNRGLEITLNTVNIKNENFSWTTNVNFSTNHNEILELYGGTVTRDIANRLFVGESLKANYYYKFDGIWQTDEATEATKYGQIPGSVKVVDQINDGKISSAANADDRVVLGDELPDWIAGITNTLTYKNWDLSFFIYTRQGVQFKNAMLAGSFGELGSNRYNKLNLNYWTATNPTNDYFGVWQANPYREAIQYKDASFWRISNITLGYNLPKTFIDRLHIGSVRCYLQASNPFVFTKENNIWMDPEFNSGVYTDDVPYATYLFGVNLSF
ncbi:MAG: SusC/RagA family TonB-linked outer membrane protein [Bacteroidetes bacterium GWF2_42_66]|nr:MAG: SusC/RagA family TonB-linked outer membrane protein [Bacteroidetes bacterium GWA2_42_15]OFY03151.1 MAG: SusC/RagA family TonB-linked outer membrane protein [Bacteroidetes bacterium GWE2_42_39]OFY45259.1 MAG: SusC/RagA family TonB-linked outer membrane protein [Bacteroidetes bacterium GWF2_42_66]HAZ02144.1 SusC/RagA family TonB-linked outer membrane protein [Marinilabiliales bacterium]HBL74093.1 SusC/RagA family TonB-linked outer membrane protein [Prolixibacteraceae bacterium]